MRGGGAFSGTGERRLFNVFRVFWPQLVAFFRRRYHENNFAEDRSREVMLTVTRSSDGFGITNHSAPASSRWRATTHAGTSPSARELPTVDLANIGDFVPVPKRNPLGPATEFNDWMKFLNEHEREAMTLRFVEEWEYHEFAAAKTIPIGAVQWRVFNSKKKLAGYLSPVQRLQRRAA